MLKHKYFKIPINIKEKNVFYHYQIIIFGPASLKHAIYVLNLYGLRWSELNNVPNNGACLSGTSIHVYICSFGNTITGFSYESGS